jgi:hypothetical protein
MPAPVPAGSSALTSSGSISYGAGETQHLDGPYAYLVSGVSAKPAPGTGRAGRGFGGSVVGGADDPGVRPG